MFKKILFAIIFISITIIIGIAGYSHFSKSKSALAAGNIINATSCEQADVQVAVNAAVDGDTVVVPAGSCIWSTGFNVSKSLTFLGSGQGQTNITDNTDTAWTHTPFWFSGAGKTVRVSGFTFYDQDQNEPNGILRVNANNVVFRFDHITFEDIRNRGAWVTGDNITGVMDHATHNIITVNSTYQGILVRWNDPIIAWASPYVFGSSEAVFVEENIYNIAGDIDGVIDCSHGGRVVFRHNVINGPGVAGNHGNDSPTRGCMALEVYDNTWSLDGSIHNSPWILQMRGGTAVWFNNAITTINGAFITNPIAFTNYRSCSDSYYPGKNQCDGNDPADQNTLPIETYRGWACLDQVGRSYNQTFEPVYEWNNTYNGADTDVYVYNAGGGVGATCYTTTHIKAGRDYYNDIPRTSYTPYTYPHPLIVATSKKGDFNFDNKVNNLDFTSFKNAFKSIFNSIFDLNSDGAIDVRDFGVLMTNWLP